MLKGVNISIQNPLESTKGGLMKLIFWWSIKLKLTFFIKELVNLRSTLASNIFFKNC